MLLLRFLMRLVNKEVTVELKNGAVITGSVSAVDTAMNFHLNTVTLTVKNREPVTLDAVSVRGSTIRYIIFPNDLNLDRIMSDPQLQLPKTSSQRRGQGAATIRGGRGQHHSRGWQRGQQITRGGGRGIVTSDTKL